MTYQAVFFDFDGVILESVDAKTRAFAALYQEHGEAVVSAVIDYHMAHGGLSRFEKFRHYEEVLLGRPLTPERSADLGERFTALAFREVVGSAWVEGAEAALKALHGRMPLFVASGTPEDELRQIVTLRGLDHYFDGVYGSPRKKDRIINETCSACGIDPQRTVMVGDAMTDYDAAKATGAAFVGRLTPAVPAFPGGIAQLHDLRGLPALFE